MPKPRPRKLNPNQARLIANAVEAEKFLERLAGGTWTPNTDICETPAIVSVRVELPGVDRSDILLTIHEGNLRVQGVKRETATSERPLCYHCVERQYGRFDRTMPLHCVVDAQRARAVLEGGVLVVELPKLQDRRGKPVEIPITRKEG